MEKIYLISGMGADERVFKYLQIKKYEVHYVKWIEPLKNESLQDYCKRLLPQIDSVNPVIAGLSFGGIVANEISKLIPVKQIILISSVRSWKELPWYFKFSGKLSLQKLVPWGRASYVSRFVKFIFQVRESEHLKLLMDMAKSTSPAFLGWVADAVVKWRGEELQGVKQIHGDKDMTFPIRYIKHADKVISGVGHIMLIQRPKEVSGFIDNTAN